MQTAGLFLSQLRPPYATGCRGRSKWLAAVLGCEHGAGGVGSLSPPALLARPRSQASGPGAGRTLDRLANAVLVGMHIPYTQGECHGARTPWTTLPIRTVAYLPR
jgi:hypothetical protein